MPRKKRSSDFLYERQKQKKKYRDKVANMTEEEKALAREKSRLYVSRVRRLKKQNNVITEEEKEAENQKVRIRRIQQHLRMTDTEREIELEKRRLATRISRALQTPEQRAKRLARLREAGAKRRLEKKLQAQRVEMQTITAEQQGQLSLFQSPIVIEATPGAIPFGDRQQDDMPEVSVKVEIEEMPIDYADLSQFTFQVAEGLIDPLSGFEEDHDETNHALFKEEPTDELSDTSLAPNSDLQLEKTRNGSGSQRGSRLSALKARAKLREAGVSQDSEVKTKRLAKLTKKLKTTYSEEYSRDNRKDLPMISKLVYEAPEKQIAGIAELLKKKNISLTDETPEQRAARIVEVLKRGKGCREAKTAEKLEMLRKRRAELSLQRLWKRCSAETPEERARRRAASAAYARDKNRMEREEFRIFQIMIKSENPVKSLQKDETTPELLQLYERFPTREKKIPEYLQEWRKMISSFFLDAGSVDESEVNQNERYANQNDELRNWLGIHEEPLKEFLTKRKNKMNDYFKNKKNKTNKILSEEEKDAQRRKFNEKYRLYYQKKKEEKGVVIRPRGERPHPNNFNKSKQETDKQKPELKPKRSKASKTKASAYSTPTAMSMSATISENDLSSTSSILQPLASHTSLVSASVPLEAYSSAVQWPTLTLCSEANVIQPECRMAEAGGQDEDGSDDWQPVSHFDDEPYLPPSHQNQHHSQSFGNHFMAATNHPNHQSSSLGFNDDLFHRLIHVPPPQHNFNSFVPQMSTHQNSIVRSSNFMQPLQFQQHHQQTWNPNPNPAQSVDEPLNYSIPFQPYSQVSMIPLTNNTSQMRLYEGINRNPQEHTPTAVMDHVQVEKESVTHKHELPAPEEKTSNKTRRRRTSGTKRIRRPRPRPRPARSSAHQRNIVPISEATPVVIKLVNPEEISKLKCPHCLMVFKTGVTCERHISKCTSIKPGFSCKVCKQIYGTQSRLVQHIWWFHRENKTYKCTLCSNEYCQKRHLYNHMKTHPSEPDSYILGSSKHRFSAEKFWCGMCPSSFNSFLKLIIHRRAHQYVCQICGIILKNADHLMEHSLRCHPDVDWDSSMHENSHRVVEESGTVEIFKCRTCDSHFSTKQFLDLHEAEGHPMREDAVIWSAINCNSCDVKFSSKPELQQHLAKCELRNLKCYWCSEVFSVEDLRIEHMTKNHSEEKKIPRNIQAECDACKCELCRRWFKSVLNLRSHFRANHIPGTPKTTSIEVENVMEKPQSDWYSRNLVRQALESVEVILHEEENSVRFAEKLETESSGKNVTETKSNDKNVVETESSYKNGSETKSSDKNVAETDVPPALSEASVETATIVVYPCQICQYNFQTKDFLDKHMSTTHPDTSKHFRVFCDICNKSLAPTTQLGRHKKSCHNTGNRKRYPCPHCELTLSRPEHLRTHIKNIHENPDPVVLKNNQMRIERFKTESKFKCEHCGAGFTRRKNLLAHIRTVHSSIEAFDFCEICGQQIKTSAKAGQDMRTHMRKFHPELIVESVPDPTIPSTYVPFGTACVKLPMLQVLELIDEIYGVDGYQNRFANPDCKIRKRRPRNKSGTKRSRKCNKSSESSSSEFSSDDDWLSEDSSEDENENSETDMGGGNFSGYATVPVRPPKISLRSLVINPKKTRKSVSEAYKNIKRRKLRTQFVSREATKNIQPSACSVQSKMMPFVVLERCDQLALSLQTDVSKSGSQE